MNRKIINYLAALCLIALSSLSLQAQKKRKRSPLMIEEQGSFAVGVEMVKRETAR